VRLKTNLIIKNDDRYVKLRKSIHLFDSSLTVEEIFFYKKQQQAHILCLLLGYEQSGIEKSHVGRKSPV